MRRPQTSLLLVQHGHVGGNQGPPGGKHGAVEGLPQAEASVPRVQRLYFQRVAARLVLVTEYAHFQREMGWSLEHPSSSTVVVLMVCFTVIFNAPLHTFKIM